METWNVIHNRSPYTGRGLVVCCRHIYIPSSLAWRHNLALLSSLMMSKLLSSENLSKVDLAVFFIEHLFNAPDTTCTQQPYQSPHYIGADKCERNARMLSPVCFHLFASFSSKFGFTCFKSSTSLGLDVWFVKSTEIRLICMFIYLPCLHFLLFSNFLV